MSPAAYAKREVSNGRFPMMTISSGEHGTFWIHDADWRMLECKAFMSREAAEKFRSKVIANASKYIAEAA